MIGPRYDVIKWLKKNDVFDIFESAPGNQMHQMICMVSKDLNIEYNEVSRLLTEIETDPMRTRAFAMLQKIRATMGENADEVHMEHGHRADQDYRIVYDLAPFDGGIRIELCHDRSYPKTERWWIKVRKVVDDNRVQLKNVDKWVQSTDINDETECGYDVIERSWIAKEGLEDHVWVWCLNTHGGTNLIPPDMRD